MANIDKILEFFYTDLEQLEQQRKEAVQNKNKANFLIISCVIVFILFVVGLVFLQVHKLIILVSTGSFLFGGIKLAGSLYNKNEIEFELYSKDNFIKKIVKFIFPNYQYTAKKEAEAKLLSTALGSTILPLNRFQNIIEGTTKEGFEFSLMEIIKEKREAHAYASLLYQIKLPVTLEGSFYHSPHADKNQDTKATHQLESIHTKDLYGNSFEIKTAHNQLTQQVLTPELLSNFIKIKKIFSTKNHIEFSLVDNSFYIIIPTIKNYLYITMNQPINPSPVVQKAIKDTNDLCSPLHLLSASLQSVLQNK